MSTLIEKLEEDLEYNLAIKESRIAPLEHSHYYGYCDAMSNAIDIVKQHSDWVSVDERLPDSDCYVIVYCDGGNVTKSFFTTDREYLRLSRNSRYTRKAYGKNSGYFAISHDDGYKVTHWQPLPQPPSEVQP